jgi:hypothetical protein
MDNVYMIGGSLKIRRMKYSWNLRDITTIRIRLEYRIKDKTDEGITYQEYQECIVLLLKGGFINEMSI